MLKSLMVHVILVKSGSIFGMSTGRRASIGDIRPFRSRFDVNH